MFESRLFFVDKLIDMGAKIILCDPHRAVVIGHGFKSNLKATKMTSPDIRAGISLLIAALSAEGTSIIHNIEQIDRGYENIDSRLNSQIDSMSERVEMMLELKVDLKNSILSLEKGRMVEYYTGFLFDFNSSDLRNNLNIAGGGRYDDLINSVSDENNIPAVGAAINLDRLEKIISSEKFKWAQYC